MIEGISKRTAQPPLTFMVTGGAGSIGRAFVEQLLEDYPNCTIRVVDNNEQAVAAMRYELKDRRLRPIVEDILNPQRMEQIMAKSDIVVNCAAAKHVSLCEYNPERALTVNVLGTQVLINAALKLGTLKGFLQLSTDKAVNPSSAMGASKLMAERLIIAANHIRGDVLTPFVAIRLPNVMQTRGNVFELWRYQKEKDEPLTVSHKEMRRYVITIHECTNLLGYAVKYLLEGNLLGGEILIPAECKEYDIETLAKEYSKNIKITGSTAGEKFREELYTEWEEPRIKKVGPLKIIHPEPYTVLRMNNND